MAKLTELPEALTLPTNAKIYVVDEDDTTDDPSGSSKQMDASLLGGGGTTNLSVLQSATFSGTGALVSASEDGWSCVKGATGYYNITFPTAATTATEQWVIGGESVQYESTATYVVAIHQLTATTCEVLIDDSGGTPSDREFTIYRRLPDAPAQAIVAIGVTQAQLDALETRISALEP